jgi:hypothetical protein
LSAEIDGEAVSNLREEFLVQSPVVGYTIPADNLLKAVSGTNIPKGTYFPLRTGRSVCDALTASGGAPRVQV